MGHRFADLLFSNPVKAVQIEENSRQQYARWENSADNYAVLGEREMAFLQQRDSCYLATVSPDGWPYIQHRGGPQGFIKVLDEQHIGFADYRGNRQYISTGNLRNNHRIALFFMDYARRQRLKMLGYAREIDRADKAMLYALSDTEYPANIERGFIIEVAAFDWNCPQHITPRYDQAELEAALSPLQMELAHLKALS